MVLGKVLLLVASVCLTHVLAQDDLFYIESPKITNWGVWGNTSLCPEREYVYAFRLKVQQDQGFLLDDTALNGIELECISPQVRAQAVKNGEQPRAAQIRSLEGGFGNWGTIFECTFPHFVIGFELRSEGIGVDNTAANNFRAICSNDVVVTGSGMGWGDWTGQLRCPTNHAICGLRTQVEARIPTPPPADNTSLNNVDLVCCLRDDL